jgi:hypothetical protein
MPFGGNMGGLKPFVSPFAQVASQVGTAYASNLISPPIPPPEEPEKFEYLPPPPPVYVGSTWSNTLHICATIASFTALAAGFGVVLGLTAGSCMGEEKVDEEESETSEDSDPSLFSENDPDKILKEEIIHNI